MIPFTLIPLDDSYRINSTLMQERSAITGYTPVMSVNLHSNIMYYNLDFCTDKVMFVKFHLSLAVPERIYRSFHGTFLE